MFSSCALFFFFLSSSSSFFLACSQPSQIGCLPYFHTWRGGSTNLECRSEMCCTRLAENTWRKESPKNSPSVHHCTTLSGCIFATKACVDKACIDSLKKLIKQQYLIQMSPQYGELRPTNDWDLLASFGQPRKFQQVSRLGFVTEATSLTGGQPNFVRCLAISWACTLYIHFWGLLPLTEFCLVQNSLCVQVLRSIILAVLLHGTPATGVSQTLLRGTRNGITEHSQRLPLTFS